MGNITLTDDTLTNIKIMAPKLNKDEQKLTLGFIIGVAMMAGKEADFEKVEAEHPRNPPKQTA